jgi:hypothetical protein
MNAVLKTPCGYETHRDCSGGIVFSTVIVLLYAFQQNVLVQLAVDSFNEKKSGVSVNTFEKICDDDAANINKDLNKLSAHLPTSVIPVIICGLTNIIIENTTEVFLGRGINAKGVVEGTEETAIIQFEPIKFKDSIKNMRSVNFKDALKREMPLPIDDDIIEDSNGNDSEESDGNDSEESDGYYTEESDGNPNPILIPNLIPNITPTNKKSVERRLYNHPLKKYNKSLQHFDLLGHALPTGQCSTLQLSNKGFDRIGTPTISFRSNLVVAQMYNADIR